MGFYLLHFLNGNLLLLNILNLLFQRSCLLLFLLCLCCELKAKVASLTAELAEYKSVRSQLNTAGLEQQNELLRNKLHRYETVIERNGLWNLFRPSTKTKDITRQEERL